VFADLMRLRRAVVFFDECEDFFKKRDDQELSTPLGSRTLGAFITAGMLPRLQALRNGGWIVFVLATNVSLSQLDPAVIRPGRFDFQVDMRNPALSAQLRYLPSVLDQETPAYRAVHEALETFAATPHDSHSEVTWAVLDDIAAKFAGTTPKVPTILTALVERIQLQGPPPLPGT
jgi:SpoVK/Ycf46/Vps4 family AAA+-type ATPase